MLTRYRSAGWADRVKTPAASAVTSPTAYPTDACRK